MKKRALYIGCSGNENLGDVLLYSVHKKLFSDLDFTAQETKEEPINFTPDVVFLGGGTLINWTGRLEIMDRFLNENVPTFCFGTGVADYEFWKAYLKADRMENWVDLLNRFSFVGVRGPESKKLLDEAGFNKSVVTGDTAIAFAKDNYEKVTEKKILGINLGTSRHKMWGDEDLFLKQMPQIIDDLMDQGWFIHFLPVWPPDVEVTNEVIKSLKNKNFKVFEDSHKSFERFEELVKECRIFMGMKLHSTIIATMNRIPSIMLEYRPKCLDYMRLIDQEKFSIRTDQINSKKIKETVSLLDSNTDEAQEKINEKIVHYKNKLFESAELIRSIYSQ